MASGFLITLLVALTYLIGVAYYAGYLRGCGLPFEFMPLERDGVLMQGAYALMQMGAPLAVPLVAASFLVVVLALVREWAVRSGAISRLTASLASTPRRPISSDRSTQIWDEPDIADSVSSRHLLSFSADAVWIILMGFSVFFALLWSMVAATRAGESQARHDVDCSSCAASELTFNDDITISGRLIRCNETHCIVQSGGKMLVLRLDDIKRIQMPAMGTPPSQS